MTERGGHECATPTVAWALADAVHQGVARLDAQLLLAHVLDRDRTWLLAHDDTALSTDASARFRDHARDRAAGVPLAYLVGRREFHGLDLVVTPDVLVPRPDTEVLVDWAIGLAQGIAQRTHPAGPLCIVDLGTGSGAVALALRRMLPTAEITATDRSAAALAVAARNAERLGLPLRLVEGDWWSAVPGTQFDLAVANPPYVAEGDPHLPALRHEPLCALTSGADGLAAITAIIAGSVDALYPGGWLLLEHGHDQADAVQRLLQQAGYTEVATRIDLGGNARCTGGRLLPVAHPSRK